MRCCTASVLRSLQPSCLERQWISITSINIVVDTISEVPVVWVAKLGSTGQEVNVQE